MATARELRELHDRLIAELGEQPGGTMIEVLERMATRDDLAHLATTRDLHDLETRIDARFDREGRRIAREISELRQDMASSREDTASQFGGVRGEMASLREDMASQFAVVRAESASLRENTASQFAALRAESASSREDMAVQFGAMRHELAELMVSRQTVVFTVIATIATLAAVIVGVVAIV